MTSELLVNDESRAIGGGTFVSFEFRSVRGIAAVWFAVFLVACFIQHVFRYSFALETFQIVVNSVGLMLASTWTVFYGELGWRRLIRYMGVVTSTTITGVSLTGYHNDFVELLLAISLAAAGSLIPFYLARKFLGWRIFHPLQSPRELGTGSQFSIAQIMSWTTFFAVLIVIANLVSQKLFRSDVPEFVFFICLAIVVPSLISLAYLWLVGRLATSWLLVATPVFSLAVATGLTTYFGVTNEFGGDLAKWIFWPNLIWFTVAGWAVSAAAWWLRSQGFVFGFGANPKTISLRSVQQAQTQRLEHEIASTAKWRRRIQWVHAWVERQFDARNSRLASELATLKEQSDSPTQDEDA